MESSYVGIKLNGVVKDTLYNVYSEKVTVVIDFCNGVTKSIEITLKEFEDLTGVSYFKS